MISKQAIEQCKRGHLYTEENTGWRRRTNKTTGHVTESRFCKECKHANSYQGYSSYEHERNLSKLDIIRENPKQCGKCLNGGWLAVDYDDDIYCVYCGWRQGAVVIGQLEMGLGE
jgi:hypothetical protein